MCTLGMVSIANTASLAICWTNVPGEPLSNQCRNKSIASSSVYIKSGCLVGIIALFLKMFFSARGPGFTCVFSLALGVKLCKGLCGGRVD